MQQPNLNTLFFSSNQVKLSTLLLGLVTIKTIRPLDVDQLLLLPLHFVTCKSSPYDPFVRIFCTWHQASTNTSFVGDLFFCNVGKTHMNHHWFCYFHSCCNPCIYLILKFLPLLVEHLQWFLLLSSSSFILMYEVYLLILLKTCLIDP